MKRLCVFYKHAHEWFGRKVEWIVCKKCQRELHDGKLLQPSYLICCCLELPHIHRNFECKTPQSRLEYFASLPKSVDQEVAAFRKVVAAHFQVPERILGGCGKCGNTHGDACTCPPVHKTKKDECPDCHHAWICHGRRAGKFCCNVRSIDGSGNFDRCGCNTVPPPSSFDVAKPPKEGRAAILKTLDVFVEEQKPPNSSEKCETCGGTEFVEAGDCPAGRWWWACAACGKRQK